MKTRQRSDTTLSEAAATVPPAELNARSASESGSHDSRREPSPTPVDPKQADAAATVRGPTQRTGVSRSQTPTRDFLEGTARAPEKLRRQATAVADGRKSSRYDAPKDEMHDFQRGGPSPYADRHSKRVAAAATMRGPTQRMGVSRSQTPARAFLEGTALPPQRLRQRDSITKSTAVDEDAAKAAWLAKLDQPSWGGASSADPLTAPATAPSVSVASSAPLAVDEDAAKTAWLAKLDQPSWGGASSAAPAGVVEAMPALSENAKAHVMTRVHMQIEGLKTKMEFFREGRNRHPEPQLAGTQSEVVGRREVGVSWTSGSYKSRRNQPDGFNPLI
jgi:hypothetical protein